MGLRLMAVTTKSATIQAALVAAGVALGTVTGAFLVAGSGVQQVIDAPDPIEITGQIRTAFINAAQKAGASSPAYCRVLASGAYAGRVTCRDTGQAQWYFGPGATDTFRSVVGADRAMFYLDNGTLYAQAQP